jgi:putative acetyltransferase
VQNTVSLQPGHQPDFSMQSASCGGIFDAAPSFRQRERQDDAGLFALFSEKQFVHSALTREPFTTSEELGRWLDALTASQRFEIVADVADTIVGFAGLYVFGDGFGHTGCLMLGVLESAQRSGLGSALLRIIVKTAHVLIGLRRLQLTVFCDNDPAIRLYQKFGFEIEGRHRCYARRGAEFVDAFMMARIFDEGITPLDMELLRRVHAGQA